MRRQTVERHLAVASLSTEAKAKARKVRIADNQSALLRVARYNREPAQQMAVIERIASNDKGETQSHSDGALRDPQHAWEAGRPSPANRLLRGTFNAQGAAMGARRAGVFSHMPLHRDIG